MTFRQKSCIAETNYFYEIREIRIILKIVKCMKVLLNSFLYLKLIKQVHRLWNTISYSLQYISIKQKHNNDIYNNNNDNINVTYAFDTI